MTRELRTYIEDLGNPTLRKLTKYPELYFWKNGGLSLYYEYLKKRYTIDQENIHFAKNDEFALIVNIDEPDGTSSTTSILPSMVIYLTEF